MTIIDGQEFVVDVENSSSEQSSPTRNVHFQRDSITHEDEVALLLDKHKLTEQKNFPTSVASDTEFRIGSHRCCSRQLIWTLIVLMVAAVCFLIIFADPESCHSNTAFGLILTITGTILGVITKKQRPNNKR